MIISDYTVPELDFFRAQCNFVGNEKDVFELRSRGVPLKIIAGQIGLTLDGVKKVSMKVNGKISKSLSF